MGAPVTEPESRAQRQFKALPDIVTAVVFLWVWIDPDGWRRELVAQGLLIMLVEFILIHSAGMLGPMLVAQNVPLLKRLGIGTGLGLFYSLFVAVWAWQFKSWWTLVFFLWLLWSKFADLLLDHKLPQQLRQEQHLMVVVSTAAYLFCVFFTLFVPLPELGLTHHGHYYGVPGSGEWVSHPHKVIAAAMLYFTILGMTKLRAWGWLFKKWGRS